MSPFSLAACTCRRIPRSHLFFPPQLLQRSQVDGRPIARPRACMYIYIGYWRRARGGEAPRGFGEIRGWRIGKREEWLVQWLRGLSGVCEVVNTRRRVEREKRDGRLDGCAGVGGVLMKLKGRAAGFKLFGMILLNSFFKVTGAASVFIFTNT